MSREQREVVQSAARERITRHRVAVTTALGDIAESIGLSVDHMDALSMNSSGGSLLGDAEGRRKLVSANQELGRDVFLASECEFHNRLEDLGLDDATVMDTAKSRINSHPATRAAARLESVQTNEAAGAEMDGRAPLRERLDQQYRIESGLEDPNDVDDARYPAVDNDEMRTFLHAAYGPDAVTDEKVRKALEFDRLRRKSTLRSDVTNAEFDLRKARRAEVVEDIAAAEDELAKAEAACEAYEESPEDPWPRDARERRALEQSLRIDTEVAAGRVPRQVFDEVDAERLDIQRQAMSDELHRVQKFGGQTVTPMATGGKVTKALTAQFNEATSLYPDEMVARAKERYPFLVLRQTSRRAHFSESARQSWSEKKDQFVTVPNLDGDPDRAFDDGISYQFDSPAYNGPENTPENRSKLEAIAAAHNAGRTRSRVPGKARRWGGSDPRALVVAEVTDNEGRKRLALKTKTKVAQKVYGTAAELTTDGSFNTTLHELGHMMERDPRVFFACKQFLYDRSEGNESVVYNTSRRHGVEKAVPDGFANTYIGKDYAGRAATEVFTMGMEGVFAQGRGGCRGINEIPRVTSEGLKTYEGVTDAEHRDLILGLIAGFQTSGPPMTHERANEILSQERRRREEARATRGSGRTSNKAKGD